MLAFLLLIGLGGYCPDQGIMWRYADRQSKIPAPNDLIDPSRTEASYASKAGPHERHALVGDLESSAPIIRRTRYRATPPRPNVSPPGSRQGSDTTPHRRKWMLPINGKAGRRSGGGR